MSTGNEKYLDYVLIMFMYSQSEFMQLFEWYLDEKHFYETAMLEFVQDEMRDQACNYLPKIYEKLPSLISIFATYPIIYYAILKNLDISKVLSESLSSKVTSVEATMMLPQLQPMLLANNAYLSKEVFDEVIAGSRTINLNLINIIITIMGKLVSSYELTFQKRLASNDDHTNLCLISIIFKLSSMWKVLCTCLTLDNNEAISINTNIKDLELKFSPENDSIIKDIDQTLQLLESEDQFEPEKLDEIVSVLFNTESQ